jgi:hypothetical protein
MIAMATINAKLDSTPLIATEAWPGALASRASDSALVVPAPRPARERPIAVNSMAVQRGINAMPPTSSRATAI